MTQWRGNQEVVPFHISSAGNKTKAPLLLQGRRQTTHTAALQLAQRTVVNIIKTETPTRETNIAAPTLGSSHASHHPRHHHQKNKRPSLTIFKHSPPPLPSQISISQLCSCLATVDELSRHPDGIECTNVFLQHVVGNNRRHQSAVIQSPMGRLTPLFNMNRWQGISRPRNGSRDPKAWEEYLLLSNHEESCRFSSPSLRLQSHPRKVEQRTHLAGRLRLSATS